jgi:prepilin-type processing-associated H-X9-DG protein
MMSILVPALAAARRYAKTVVCRANLKQWGLILDAYTNDNNGLFFGGVVGSEWDDWIELLRPFYGKKAGLTFCPLATKTADEGGHGVYAAWQDEEGNDYGSYGLNGWVCNPEPGAFLGDELYWKTAGVKGAQNVPVFLDCLWMAGWPDHSSIPPEYNGQPPQAITVMEQMKNFCIDRHGKGETNCLFMDWSVNSVGLKQLWKLKWHRNFDINGPWTKNHDPAPNWPQWMKNFKD